jgi:hypothetical protein
MTRSLRFVLTMAIAFTVTACGDDTARRAQGHDSQQATDSVHAGGSNDTAAHGHDVQGNAGETLLVIMQRLGGNMTALTHALMTDDHPAVRTQAAAIAQHAPIATEDVFDGRWVRT